MKIELKTEATSIVLFEESRVNEDTFYDAVSVIKAFDALAFESDAEMWLEIDGKDIGYKQIETDQELNEFWSEMNGGDDDYHCDQYRENRFIDTRINPNL